jgi:hypothetical protein
MDGAAPPGSSALLAAFTSSNHWLTIDLPRVRLDKPRTNLLRATQTFKSSLYVYFCSPVFGAGRCPTEVRRRVEQKGAKGTKVVADLSSQRNRRSRFASRFSQPESFRENLSTAHWFEPVGIPGPLRARVLPGESRHLLTSDSVGNKTICTEDREDHKGFSRLAQNLKK